MLVIKSHQSQCSSLEPPRRAHESSSLRRGNETAFDRLVSCIDSNCPVAKLLLNSVLSVREMHNVAWTYILVFAAKALAAGGGLGGGGLLVPIFIIVAHVKPSEATPLSVCSIAGGAVFNYMAYSRRRRADGAPLIDYGAALLILTPLLMGTMLGALGDQVLPQLAIVLCMSVALTAMFIRTVRKGLATWRQQERLEPAGEEGAASGAEDAERTLPPLYPQRTLAYAVAAWVVVFSAALARGGHGAPSVLPGGVPCGGSRYWVLFFTAWAALGALTVAVRQHVMQASQVPDEESDSMQAGHADVGPDDVPLLGSDQSEQGAWSGGSDGGGSDSMEPAPSGGIDDRLLRHRSQRPGRHTHAHLSLSGRRHAEMGHTPRVWTRRRATLVPLVAFIAGVGAGLLGIGGGMLVGPLLLELGVEPRGVAATGAFVVFAADSSVVAQFAVLGLLPESHGATLALTSFVGTAVGQVAAERAIAATGRTAVVTLIIATVIGISALSTGAVAIKNFSQAAGQGEATGWRPLCPAEHDT